MTNVERHHFPGDAKMKKYLRRVRELVEKVVQEGARTPEDISFQLNRAGLRTWKGIRWNARTARFLVSFLNNPAPPRTIQPTKKSPHTSEQYDSDIINFANTGLSYQQLHDGAMPAIVNLRKKKNITDPALISAELIRIRVPSKVLRWTPEAVRLLLELDALGIRTNAGIKSIITHELKQRQTESIAEKLARLGRVTITGKKP